MTRPAIERFAAKYEVRKSGCWIWTAFTRDGYGMFKDHGRAVSAHRWAYEYWREAIPKGLVIDHLCRVPACVNPWHLEAVTHRVNILRGIGPAAVHAAQTHCKSGHEFTGGNTIRTPARRKCRACGREAQARYRKLRRADTPEPPEGQ